MNISGASNVVSAERAAESSVLMARKVLTVQRLEGMAALSLIQQAHVPASKTDGSLLDIYA
ncbi:MAG: hypothetical protein ED859_07555 [Desulfuromonadales bacterium]|nr:MAG: hypothetical protein ED859_07555 [Desulfuromonadales bacterium]